MNNSKITDVWIDTNVVLRYLMHDDEQLFAESCKVMEMAERGLIKLHLSVVNIAELVWVLNSFYNYSKEQTAETVSEVVNAQGMEAEERELVLGALADFATLNVDFIDAYLAAKAVGSDWPVFTFDKAHFNRLAAERFEPK
jgi:predicted nucleic-acid-binding protein